jgi:hypothetical protein
MSSDEQLRAIVERIEALVAECAASPDPATRRNAQELVQLLMRLYGAGLARILRMVELHDASGRRTVDALLGDDLVASLLVLHDLHPEDDEARIRRGLERLEAPVGATIRLLEVRDGTARVHLDDERGAASLLDVERLIDDVVRAVAPNIAVVDIAGLPVRPPLPLVQLKRATRTDRPAGRPVR